MAFLRVCDRCDRRMDAEQTGRGMERPMGWSGLVISARETDARGSRPITNKYQYELCGSCTQELIGWFR